MLEIGPAMLREDPARPADQGRRRRVMDMNNKVSPVPSREKPRLNSCERSSQAYHRPLRRNIPGPRQRREQHWLVYREAIKTGRSRRRLAHLPYCRLPP
jgi:hypothetical protein